MEQFKSDNRRDFYNQSTERSPEELNKEEGYFNVFKLEPYVRKNAKKLPYKKRDYYKIMLALGDNKVLFADQVIDVKKQALSFSNPHIPYKWEHPQHIHSGFFCIFDKAFFNGFGNINQYSVFKPGSRYIFQVSNEQVKEIILIFERMFTEIAADYVYKNDVLRTLAFELIHMAMKMKPSVLLENQQVDGNRRISMLFTELLERQFPIDNLHQKVEFRTASQFADQLAVHVNHLNRAIKNTLGKTTSQVIAERILQESKVLLKQNDWNISEIAFTLGFSEVPHFNNFFKKHTQLSPTRFKSEDLN